MMEVYPFGGILAYLKYHLIDGVMKQMVLMIDKTRVNYDKGAKEIGRASCRERV